MKRAEPGWAVLALAGIAALIGSFLPFYTFGRGVELTVWNRSLFPTATLITLLVFGIALEAMFVLLMGHEPRSPFLNFTWSQARLAGSAFAIVLALSYVVQGRAGGKLGSGYLVLSLSTVASFAGAVMTRRTELALGREDVRPAEHPWRAAFARWRGELTEKVSAYAAGGKQAAQPPPPIETMASLPGSEVPDSTSKGETPAPSPIPRLSAVQSQPEAEDESGADGDKPATGDEAASEVEAASASDDEPTAELTAETKAGAETKADTEVEADDHETETERERPAAPG